MRSTIDALFGVAGPTEIEIGPGRGGFLFERAVAAPDARILGLEIRRKWAHVVDERLRKAGLGARVRSLADDAKIALPRLRPDASVRAFFLHFPDPWWKKRHEKRLVMGMPLLDEIARLLLDGGDLYVQTDVEERALQYEEVITAHAAFVPSRRHRSLAAPRREPLPLQRAEVRASIARSPMGCPCTGCAFVVGRAEDEEKITSRVLPRAPASDTVSWLARKPFGSGPFCFFEASWKEENTTMVRTSWSIAAVAIAVGVVGCGKSTSGAGGGSTTANGHVDRLRAERDAGLYHRPRARRVYEARQLFAKIVT